MQESSVDELADAFYDKKSLNYILSSIKKDNNYGSDPTDLPMKGLMPTMLISNREDLKILLYTPDIVSYVIDLRSRHIKKNNEKASYIAKQRSKGAKNHAARMFLASCTVADTIDSKYLEWIKPSYLDTFSQANKALHIDFPNVGGYIVCKESEAAERTFLGFNKAMENNFIDMMENDPSTWWDTVQQMRKFDADRKQVFADMYDCSLRLIRHFAR